MGEQACDDLAVSNMAMCSFEVVCSEIDSYQIDSEYNSSWTEISPPPVEGRHELRIELESVLKLGDPSYRIGDLILKKRFGLAFNGVYANVILGDRFAKTSVYPRPCERAVYFENERMIFVHTGEPFFQFQMFTKHAVQKDALIGKANVPILSKYLDGFAHQVNVEILRKHEPAGMLSVQIQMRPV